MPGTAVTKSVVAHEPGGRKREEIFVDIIEKISVTFSSSVSYSLTLSNTYLGFSGRILSNPFSILMLSVCAPIEDFHC